jgi:hypothetical protein
MKRDVPHFRIGLLLTEAGIIEPVQLDAAIQRGEESGEPFLRTLVGAGILKQHELQAVIRAQSLIWGGMLDVERAIEALSIVHSNNCTLDEGLNSVGWVRPKQDYAETEIIQTPLNQAVSMQVKTRPLQAPTSGLACQFCGSPLERLSNICPFCAGENQRNSAIVSTKVHIEPAWQRQAGVANDGRIVASSPARDPILMGLLSGICVPGLGQMALGQAIKGVVLLVVTVILSFITGGVALLVLMPILGVDAYLVADKLRDGRTVGQWEFF